MQNYVVESSKGKKSRSFMATLMAGIVRGPSSPNDNIRPIFAVWAGSEAQLRPFLANLRLGRPLSPPNARGTSERMEFLKSAPFDITLQKEVEGVLATVYHTDLFRVDPGMIDPEGMDFVMLAPNEWVVSESPGIDTRPMVEHVSKFGYNISKGGLRELAVPSYLFAAYVDRRTRCPLPTDGRFYLQLLCSALQCGLASLPHDGLRGYYYLHEDRWGFNNSHRFHSVGLDDIGIHTAISFQSKHELFEEFLAEQVSIFFKRSPVESE